MKFESLIKMLNGTRPEDFSSRKAYLEKKLTIQTILLHQQIVFLLCRKAELSVLINTDLVGQPLHNMIEVTRDHAKTLSEMTDTILELYAILDDTESETVH